MLSNVLFILLGAGLVSIGFLVAAFAERLRTPRARAVVETPAEHYGTAPARPQERPPLGVGPVEPRHPTSPVRSPQAPRPAATHTPAPRPSPSPGGEGDVIAALVAAGYKKPVATEATRACNEAERATIEGWTVAALRHCAGVS